MKPLPGIKIRDLENTGVNVTYTVEGKNNGKVENFLVRLLTPVGFHNFSRGKLVGPNEVIFTAKHALGGRLTVTLNSQTQGEKVTTYAILEARH